MKVSVLGYGTVGVGVCSMLEKAPGLELVSVLVRPGKADNAEFYLRCERQEAAFAACDAKHRDDPVWQFFEIDAQLDTEISGIRALREFPQMQDRDYGAALVRSRERFRRRAELAERIAEMFRKSAK